MNEFSTYEFVVAQKNEGGWKLARIGMIVLYVCFVAGCFLLGIAANVLPPLALVPVFTWMLVFFTWRYVSVEYEYSIVSGSMILCKICGGRIRRRKAEIRIKNMHAIAPYDGAYIKAAQEYAPEVTLDFTSSMQSPLVCTA